MINRKMLLAACTLAGAAAFLPMHANASGALAVGVTDNPRDGIAYGFAWNYKTEAEAREVVMRKCREYTQAPKANQNCRLIGSFSNGCFALAFDPKSDSSGMGWAIAQTRSAARDGAMANCQDAAPPGRREFCKIDNVRCDGDPND